MGGASCETSVLSACSLCCLELKTRKRMLAWPHAHPAWDLIAHEYDKVRQALSERRRVTHRRSKLGFWRKSCKIMIPTKQRPSSQTVNSRRRRSKAHETLWPQQASTQRLHHVARGIISNIAFGKQRLLTHLNRTYITYSSAAAAHVSTNCRQPRVAVSKKLSQQITLINVVASHSPVIKGDVSIVVSRHCQGSSQNADIAYVAYFLTWIPPGCACCSTGCACDAVCCSSSSRCMAWVCEVMVRNASVKSLAKLKGLRKMHTVSSQLTMVLVARKS